MREVLFSAVNITLPMLHHRKIVLVTIVTIIITTKCTYVCCFAVHLFISTIRLFILYKTKTAQ